MPVAAALLKLALFVLWALPTYKSTVEMLEMRERRLGLLPPEDKPDNEDATGDSASAAPESTSPVKTAKKAPAKKTRANSQKPTRTK